MPIGLEPLTPHELRAIRLWIYFGAPETGIVAGTEELLGACLPPAQPISIDPLPPPAANEGVQFVMPPWPLPKHSEFEGCFATYYDFTEQVPEEFKNPTGELFRWKGFEVRQDPQSHHLLLYYSPLNLEPGGVDVHDPSFGTWTCVGGAQRRRGLRAHRPRLLRRGSMRQQAEAVVRLRRLRTALDPAGRDHRRRAAGADQLRVLRRRLPAAADEGRHVLEHARLQHHRRSTTS